MVDGGLDTPTLRILRPIVFAGALDGPDSLACCQGPGLSSAIAALTAGGYVEDMGVLVPTDRGVAAVESWYAKDRADISDRERDAMIDKFRPLDIEVKRLSIAWQDADDKDDWDARMAVIEALTTLQNNTLAFIAAHAVRVPRWEEFGDRLQVALDAVLDGQTEYIVSVRLPSYHTIWFEFHEDLLRTLERQRDVE